MNTEKVRPKTFTAGHLKAHAGEVFLEVDRHGECIINHNSYKDRVFIITSRERGKAGEAK